jgi:hypothetical protein
MDTSDWVAVGSLGLATISAGISVAVAYSQNALTRRAYLFPFASEILSELRSSDFRMRLDYVEQDLSAECPQAPDGRYRLTDAARGEARPVMSYFNTVGLLVVQNALAIETVASVMGGSVVRAWEVLAPYIYDERERRGGDPNYYGYFEHLAVVIQQIGPAELKNRLALMKSPPR